MMSVVSPVSAATILMLVRVLPGTRWQASAMPLRANSASNAAALSCPSSPSATTGAPQSARQLATLMPLPPALRRACVATFTAPGRRLGRLTVSSMAGWGVMVRMGRGMAFFMAFPASHSFLKRVNSRMDSLLLQ